MSIGQECYGQNVLEIQLIVLMLTQRYFSGKQWVGYDGLDGGLNDGTDMMGWMRWVGWWIGYDGLEDGLEDGLDMMGWIISWIWWDGYDGLEDGLEDGLDMMGWSMGWI